MTQSNLLPVILATLLSGVTLWWSAALQEPRNNAMTFRTAAPPEPHSAALVIPQPPADSCPSFPLPDPSSMTAEEYERIMIPFLKNGCYKSWVSDREIRNTGPFVNNADFGTHPAVKIYYSPEFWDWVKNRNRKGEIPDGSMIVKEQYTTPASPTSTLTGWSIMIRDKQGSWDGWFWDGHGLTDTAGGPIDYKGQTFGTYCMRCHASAEGTTSTFSTERNVEGDPVSYRVNVPTMTPISQPPHMPGQHERIQALTLTSVARIAVPSDVAKLILETYDHVHSGAGGPEQFLTSDQCIGCHGASDENMSITYTEKGKKPINLSPYTEWRSSMMGLAGRDPIFHAQVEAERAQFPDKSEFLDNKCFSCHGVMGQRQLQIDSGKSFSHEMIYASLNSPHGKYGALARDGVSCMSCHQMSARDLGKPSTFTAQFHVDTPGTINGPYTDVLTVPMHNALGITPRYAPQITSSALCGSCHTVITPTFDKNGIQIGEFHEQTTYMEWLNSNFQDENPPVDSAAVRSCQNCHMPNMYDGRQLKFKVANIEDETYPFTDNRLPDKDIALTVRDNYSRHTLVGVNVFANQMFQQFPDVLGILTGDYMYAQGVAGLVTTENSMLQLARNETATLEVASVRTTSSHLEVEVKVTNLAGHSFPSGVEFRRAFLGLVINDEQGRALWASGLTNADGEILDGLTGKVLATEYFGIDPNSGKNYQPHYDRNAPVTKGNQVQIYEELVADSDGKLTNSFVRLHEHVKDNRLLPRGWKPDGPYAEFTSPFGGAAKDPGYIPVNYRKGDPGSQGSNTVLYRIPLKDMKGKPHAICASLDYQSIPPYYLADRFSLLEKGLAAEKIRETRRLKFLKENLRVKGTAIEGWKLRLACTSRNVDGGAADCAKCR